MVKLNALSQSPFIKIPLPLVLTNCCILELYFSRLPFTLPPTPHIPLFQAFLLLLALKNKTIIKYASYTIENAVFSLAFLRWKTLRSRILRYFPIISVSPKMMYLTWPTTNVPQTVTSYCKTNILGIFSSISNETTEVTLVSTVNLHMKLGSEATTI